MICSSINFKCNLFTKKISPEIGIAFIIILILGLNIIPVAINGHAIIITAPISFFAALITIFFYNKKKRNNLQLIIKPIPSITPSLSSTPSSTVSIQEERVTLSMLKQEGERARYVSNPHKLSPLLTQLYEVCQRCDLKEIEDFFETHREVDFNHLSQRQLNAFPLYQLILYLISRRRVSHYSIYKIGQKNKNHFPKVRDLAGDFIYWISVSSKGYDQIAIILLMLPDLRKILVPYLREILIQDDRELDVWGKINDIIEYIDRRENNRNSRITGTREILLSSSPDLTHPLTIIEDYIWYFDDRP